MTWHYDLNFTIGSTAGELVEKLVDLLMGSGQWTHQASCDGLGTITHTPGNGNNVFASGDATAWIVIANQEGHQLGFRASSSTAHYIIFIPANTDGTPQARTADGTDGNLPAFATYHDLVGTIGGSAGTWISGPTTKRWAVATDDESAAFYCFGWDSDARTTSVGGCLLWDPLVDAAEDDLCPFVIHAMLAADSAMGKASIADFTGEAWTYLSRGEAHEQWVTVGAIEYAVRQGSSLVDLFPAGGGVALKAGRAPIVLPFLYGRRDVDGGTRLWTSGYLGRGSLMRWRTANLVPGTPVTIGGEQWIVIEDVLVRWPHATGLVLP